MSKLTAQEVSDYAISKEFKNLCTMADAYAVRVKEGETFQKATKITGALVGIAGSFSQDGKVEMEDFMTVMTMYNHIVVYLLDHKE